MSIQGSSYIAPQGTVNNPNLGLNTSSYWNTPTPNLLNTSTNSSLLDFSSNSTGIANFQASSPPPLNSNTTMTLGELAKQYQSPSENTSTVASTPASDLTEKSSSRNALSNPLGMVSRIMKGDIISNEEIFSTVDDGLFKDAGLNEVAQASVKSERLKKTGKEEQFGNTPYPSVNMKKASYISIARYDLPFALKLQEADIQRAIKEEETQVAQIEEAATKGASAKTETLDLATVAAAPDPATVATPTPAPVVAAPTPAPEAQKPVEKEVKKNDRPLDLENSQEDRKTAVDAAYQKILGRSVDPAGEKTYTNNLKKGWSIERIEQDLRRSDEYKSKKK
ncbi:MAG: hypothetical protein ACK5T0_04195 [Vampirovibrionales bacterium]